MKVCKDYMTVEDLQETCRKMKLTTEGLKCDLIGRILSHEPTETTCIETFSRGIQTIDEYPVPNKNLQHKYVFKKIFSNGFFKSILVFGATVGVSILSSHFLFNKYETLEIPVAVKRSWW